MSHSVHRLFSFKISFKGRFFLCRLGLRVGFLYRLGFSIRVSSAYFCIFWGFSARVMVSAAISRMIMNRRSEPINFCALELQIADEPNIVLKVNTVTLNFAFRQCICIFFLKYRKYTMYFKPSILNTLTRKYFKYYFKYFFARVFCKVF